MSSKDIYILLPFAGMICAWIIREIVDGKLRSILKSRNLDPNPSELEVNSSFLSWRGHRERLAHNIAFRKSIDPHLGLISHAAYIVHFIMTGILIILCISRWKYFK